MHRSTKNPPRERVLLFRRNGRIVMAVALPNIAYEQLADYCRRNQIAYLALFGSAVRGELRPDSDFDLLVEFTPDAHIGFLALGRIQRELAALFDRPVDLVPRGGLKPLIRQEVLQSARVLYAE